MPCALPFDPDLELAEQVALSYVDGNWFHGNIQARIMVRNGRTMVATAGSNDKKDWLQDFQAFLVERHYGKIFHGWADMAEPTKDAFLATIKTYPPPYDLGGHSAGGPVTLLWALWMAEIGLTPRRVQLLACPLVWNEPGARYYQSFHIPTLRIANYHDPVAALPGVGLGGYYESPQLVLDSDGIERECQDIPEKWQIAQEAYDVMKYHGAGANYVRPLRIYTQSG